jgi:predicted DNA binding CopG/RHH family protein
MGISKYLKKADKSNKTEMISTRFTVDELKMIAEEASKRGISASEYIRIATRELAKKDGDTPADETSEGS